MAYAVNRYQAERLARALDAIREETSRYLERMAGLLGEALDGERGDGAAESDRLADLISDHLHERLGDVVAAVSEHYEIESPASFPRLAKTPAPRDPPPPVATRPPLPSRSLPPDLAAGEYARALHVQRDGARFMLVLVSHVISRRGEKDTFAQTISRHATLGEAVAAMQAYGAPAKAEAA
jgi:hypothetical protein